MKERLFNLVHKQDIYGVIDFLRQPNSHKVINLFNKNSTPLGHAFYIKKNKCKTEEQNMKTDIIIASILACGSNAILNYDIKKGALKLTESAYGFYNDLYNKIYKEEKCETILSLIGEDCLKYASTAFVLNEIDSVIKNKFVCIISDSGKAESIFQDQFKIFDRKKGADNAKAWSELCMWYLGCVFHEKKLLVGSSNNKYPFKIFYEYMSKLKGLKKTPELLKQFTHSLSTHIDVAKEFDLVDNKYISPFLAQDLIAFFDQHVEDKMLVSGKKSKRKKKKKSKAKTPEVIVDMNHLDIALKVMAQKNSKELCEEFLKNTLILRNIANPNKTFSIAFDKLQTIINVRIDLRVKHLTTLSNKFIVNFWNAAIKILLIRNIDAFDDANVKSFVEEAIKHFDLSQIDFSLIKSFASSKSISIINFKLFGSRATQVLLDILDIKIEGFSAQDWDFLVNNEQIFKRLKADVKSIYPSFSLTHNGQKIDFVLEQQSFVAIDSFKNFKVDFANMRLIAGLEDLLRVIRNQRLFNLDDINPGKLAYLMREKARTSMEINPEFQLYVDNKANEQVVQKAIGLYMTKYITSIESKVFCYFDAVLSKCIDFLSNIKPEMKDKMHKIIKNIIDKNLLVDNGINYFVSIYYAMLRKGPNFKMEEKDIMLAENIFPKNVIFFSNMILTTNLGNTPKNSLESTQGQIVSIVQTQFDFS